MNTCNNALVATIANKFVVMNDLPRVKYRTLCDIFLDVCFWLQLWTMASAFLVMYFHNEYDTSVADWVNIITFVINIGIFLIMVLYCYYMYEATKAIVKADIAEAINTEKEVETVWEATQIVRSISKGMSFGVSSKKNSKNQRRAKSVILNEF